MSPVVVRLPFRAVAGAVRMKGKLRRCWGCKRLRVLYAAPMRPVPLAHLCRGCITRKMAEGA